MNDRNDILFCLKNHVTEKILLWNITSGGVKEYIMVTKGFYKGYKRKEPHILYKFI